MMQTADTARIATLAGQVAIPFSVSGVTTAPSSIPIMMKQMRASGIGTFMGRPIRAAAATANIEPETRPAGRPIRAKPMPPAAPIVSVSPIWIRSRRGDVGGGIDRSRTAGRLRESRPAPRILKALSWK